MYSLAALGGTFDRLHTGHQTLLSHAFNISHKVIVGITTDNFILEKDLSHLIEPYEKRKKSVLEYASKLKRGTDIEIVPLRDIFGPTLTDQRIDCLVVSPLTEKGAHSINAERMKYSLARLPLEVCRVEISSDNQAISSTRIRRGEINRLGFVYSDLLTKNITLNPKQIKDVKKPFGKLYLDFSSLQTAMLPQKNNIVTVGDTATHLFLEHEFPIKFGVFDNLEQRRPVIHSLHKYIKHNNLIHTHNEPGKISQNLTQALVHAMENNSYVEVDGEEDLAVIPLTLLLPLGGVIIYGQPNEGLVMVEITEEKKEWVKRLLSE